MYISKSVSLKTIVIVLVAVAVLAAGGFAAAFYLNKSDAPTTGSGSTMILDESALEGGTGGKSIDEMLAEMQEKADMSSIVVDYAEDMVFADGESEGDVKIGNRLENIFPMQFVVSLQDTGDVLYESDLVPIGSHIEKIKLSKDLDKGVYPAVLTYKSYDEGTEQFVSNVSVAVTITVQS